MAFEIIQLLLYGILIFLLFYAVIKDFKERLVSDYVWILGFIAGFILYTINYFFNPGNQNEITQKILINVICSIIIGIVFYLPKYLFDVGILGEADILAFVLVAFLVPYRLNSEPYTNHILTIIPVVFDVIVNCFVIFGCFLVFIFFRNIIFYFKGNPLFDDSEGTFFIKFFIVFSGIRIKTMELDKYRHINLLEGLIPLENENIDLINGNDNEIHNNGISIQTKCQNESEFGSKKKKKKIMDKNLENNPDNDSNNETNKNPETVELSDNWILQPTLSYEELYKTEELGDLKKEILSTGKNYIWITYLAPFMIFILLSVIITPWTGNLVFKFLEYIL